MKIVLIDKEEGQKVGGITTYNNRFIFHAKKKGHEVFVLRFCKKKPKEKNVFRIPYYIAEQRSFIILPTENSLHLIWKYLKKIQPDALYTALGISPLDFFLPKLCNELHIPLCAVWHADFNTEQSSYQILLKSIFLAYLPLCKQLDMLHLFSEKLESFYQRRGVSKEKLFVLPNGIDSKAYSPGASQFAKKNKIKRGIIFLGRLTLQKNPEILIKSFLSLKTDKSTKLVLVGFGDLEDNLKETYGNNKQIIFTGAIRDEQKKIDILRGCQIFVLPSRFEGMPLALLEGMSTGLACIATDAGTNTELIAEAGIVLQNSKLRSSLPHILELLIKNPEFTRILGKRARIRIVKNFQQEKIFDTLLTRFDKIRHNYSTEKKPPFDINDVLTDTLKEIWRKAIDFNVNI